MLSTGEDVEAAALFKRGWKIAAIARHLDRDRGTISAYLEGRSRPGVRRASAPDVLAPFAAYARARFIDDPHLWASALFDEVVPLGYAGAYPSFARQLRPAGLRPHCEACSGVKGRETTEIDHPAGDEIQWDWAERRRAPWGGTCYGLLGTLAHSGRTREVLCESMDQAHLIEAIDGVLRRLGGTARTWRTDRLATVIVPGSAQVQPSFAPVAKYYGAIVVPCPPRRGNRKGAVECGVKFMCGRWWRTMTATTQEEAQLSVDRFWATTGDARRRPPGRYAAPDELVEGQRPRWPTVGELADTEPLLTLPPVPYRDCRGRCREHGPVAPAPRCRVGCEHPTVRPCFSSQPEALARIPYLSRRCKAPLVDRRQPAPGDGDDLGSDSHSGASPQEARSERCA